MIIYKVGGCVRDIILGHKINDYDYVVIDSSIQEMLDNGFQKVGSDFPVFLHPKTKDEYALARTERKTGLGYFEFSCETKNVTLKDDLLRRDLTINAIAMDCKNNIIDPFNGQQDIKNKILKPVSDAFKEDPLRLLRVARFKTKLGQDWKIDSKIYEYAKELKEELKTIKKERIYKETKKAFEYKYSSLFFKTLKELDILDVVFPEIYNMICVEHNNKYHQEGDVFNHTMMALDLCKNDIQKFAILFHDVAKPISKNIDGNFHSHMESKYVVPLFETIKQKYNLSKKEYETALYISLEHHRIQKLFTNELKPSKILKILNDIKTQEKLENILNIVMADINGRIGIKKQIVLTKENIINLWIKLKNIKFDCSKLTVNQIKSKSNDLKINLIKQFLENSNNIESNLSYS